MKCEYTFVGKDGEKTKVVGIPALKAYLASGALAELLPARAAEAGMVPQFSRTRTQTPEFRRSFGSSKVVDASGEPLVLYHGTNADFNAFKNSRTDVGMHFGTQGQAEDRLSYQRNAGVKTEEGMQIMPVYLSIKNPLRLPDLGAWNADTMDYQLINAFPNDKQIINRLKTPKQIRDYLMGKGYDGIVYKNTGEVAGSEPYRQAIDVAKAEKNKVFPKGKNSFSPEDQKVPEYKAWEQAEKAYQEFREANGEDSYIAFDPKQILSATGNVGAYGQRPITKDEAARFGMTVKEANDAQAKGDIRFKQSADVNTPAMSVKAADQSPAQSLNRAMAQYYQNDEWKGAYDSVELPDSLSDVGKAFSAAFGKSLEPIAPTSPKYDLFNGVYIGGSRSNSLYVNVNSNVGFLQVGGHELWHSIARERPDLIKWYRGVAAAHYKNTDLYKSRLNALLQPGEAPYSDDLALEELEADVLGDSLTDHAFLQKLAEASPSKFKALMSMVQRWLATLSAKLKGLKSEQYVNDIEALRSHLAKVVVAFAEGKDISSVEEFAPSEPSFSRTEQARSENLARFMDGSKLVNEDGSPMRLYHGTDKNITKFKAGKDGGALGSGIYLTPDAAFAGEYAKRESGNVLPVYGSIKNPLIIESNGAADPSVALLVKLGVSQEKAEKIVEKAYDDKGYITTEIKSRAQKQGYDGIMQMRDGKLAEVVVWNSTQIKSATGNNGNYDSSNPDIRFSRKAAEPESAKLLTPPEQGLLRRVQAAMQNSMNRVKQVQDRIVELTGKKIEEYADYYGAETNRPGRIAARKEDAENSLFKPLMTKLAKSGHSQADLEELLHAMHAQERNEAVERINPDVTDGSGMTTERADEILAKYKDNAELKKLATEARAIAKATLDMKLAYGLVTQESYDALAKAYKSYVPLKGDGEYGVKVKRAMGHEERDEQILGNIARDHDQAIVAGEKNLARVNLLALVLNNPDSELWDVGIPPKGRYVAGTVFSVNKNGSEVASFTSQAQVSAFLEGKGQQAGQYEVMVNGERVKEFVRPLQDNEVMVYVDGQPVRIQIRDERLASQLRPLNQGQMNPILEGMRTVTRYLSKIYTGYNPAFILRNTARDAMTGTINILGNEGAVVAAKAWANYPSALKAMGQWAATKKLPAGEMGKYLAEYRANGGKVGASWMSDLEQQGKTLERLFDDAYGATGYARDGKIGKASLIAGRKIVGGMAHVVEIANQATENALRLALFTALRKQGVSVSKAAQAAKNVTVDFDRKGTMTGALGAIYLFFNPAVQGTANALKTLVKGQHKGQAMTALGGLAMLGAYAASQGMGDDEDRWLGEGWETRSKNFIMNLGSHQLRVPVSQEFAPFYAMGVAITEALHGESRIRSAARVMSSFIDAYVPLQGAFKESSDNHVLDAVQASVPTVLRPAFDSAANRSSFGSQIVPESSFTKDKPDNLKMNRNTKNTVFDKAAQGIAQAGQATGSGTYENDWSKVSPETLKFMWRTYTGGLGAFVTDSIGVASMTADNPAQVEAGDVPIVKDFVRTTDVKQIRSRFYELSKEARAISQEFEQAKKAGDDAAIDTLLSNPSKEALFGLDKLIKQTSKAAAALRDEAVEINADTKMTSTEKRAALKSLEKDEEDLYRDAIKAFK